MAKHKMTTHQKILHVFKNCGWIQPHTLRDQLAAWRFGDGRRCSISESSLTRRLREMKASGVPVEMKRANKSGAACVYRLKK